MVFFSFLHYLLRDHTWTCALITTCMLHCPTPISSWVHMHTSNRLSDNSTSASGGHLQPPKLIELLIFPLHLLFSILVIATSCSDQTPGSWSWFFFFSPNPTHQSTSEFCFSHLQKWSWIPSLSAYPNTPSLIVLLHQDIPVSSILAHIQSASQKQPVDGIDFSPTNISFELLNCC